MTLLRLARPSDHLRYTVRAMLPFDRVSTHLAGRYAFFSPFFSLHSLHWRFFVCLLRISALLAPWPS